MSYLATSPSLSKTTLFYSLVIIQNPTLAVLLAYSPWKSQKPSPSTAGDAAHEEHNSDFDDPSRWEFVSAFDKDISTTQVTSVESADESSTLSTAQEIIAWYRAVHGSDHAPESATTEIKEKGLPQIPDDQRSMYTLATSADAQSTMDMMWRPRPKVHMCRTDQRALIQAIFCRASTPSNTISIYIILRTRLPRCNDTSPSAARKPSPIECSTFNSKPSKRCHSRSKSSHGTQQSRSTTYSPSRKLSAGGLLPSLFSPQESTQVQHVPNLTAVAKALVSDPSQSKSAAPLPVHNKTPSTHTSMSSRGRRMRKESKVISVGRSF
ncbi:hypothetical protein J3R82DRAFT_11544 [Butyriboletus roseoflavus]|nr:hypothetical protein J3R82DRAFT_11544 [Butyriboletus roseoflavus]